LTLGVIRVLIVVWKERKGEEGERGGGKEKQKPTDLFSLSLSYICFRANLSGLGERMQVEIASGI